MDAIRRGQTFEHQHFLRPDWRPDLYKGERYSDGPKAVMRVTAVQNGRVYYCFDSNVTGEGAWSMTRAEFVTRYADHLTDPEGAVTITCYVGEDYPDRRDSRVLVIDYDEVSQTSRVEFPDGYRAVVARVDLTTREA